MPHLDVYTFSFIFGGVFGGFLLILLYQKSFLLNFLQKSLVCRKFMNYGLKRDTNEASSAGGGVWRRIGGSGAVLLTVGITIYFHYSQIPLLVFSFLVIGAIKEHQKFCRVLIKNNFPSGGTFVGYLVKKFCIILLFIISSIFIACIVQYTIFSAPLVFYSFRKIWNCIRSCFCCRGEGDDFNYGPHNNRPDDIKIVYPLEFLRRRERERQDLMNEYLQDAGQHEVPQPANPYFPERWEAIIFIND